MRYALATKKQARSASLLPLDLLTASSQAEQTTPRTLLYHGHDTIATKQSVTLIRGNRSLAAIWQMRARNRNDRLECLAKFIVFGKRHMGYLISEFVTYYNTTRSHMARETLPPVRGSEPEEVATLKMNEVVVRSHVGGLVKSFERKAA